LKKLSLLFLIVVAFCAWDVAFPAIGGGLISSAAAAEIEIYTASYCSECQRAKAYMKAADIAFTEYDIENDIARRREFYARGGKGIPLLFVGGRAMHGFDALQFEELRVARH
jgi:glutaredoxin